MSDKKREMKLQGRSAGDGQESHSFSSSINGKKRNDLKTLYKSDADRGDLSFSSDKILPPISEVAQKLKKVSLFTAIDPQLLNSPPVEVEKAVKILLPPSIVTHSQKVSLYHQRREPKFVPYEPYKACVKPMKGNVRRKIELTDKIVIDSQPKLTIGVENFGQKSTSNYESLDKFKCIISDFECEKVKWEKEISLLSSNTQKLKEELKAEQKEIIHLKQQLSTQSQVNNELKKLLVASVGEDVQGRVQCLTEDKARMATMIRKYSEKVDQDFEEKEKMSIQCDVWRSKFLASSLLVDELARWKGTLMQRYQRAEDALRVLLQENEVSRNALILSYKHLRQIHDAFDPLKCDSASVNFLESADVLSLSVALSGISEGLRDRLLGDMGRAIGGPDLRLPEEARSPGEKMAVQVLESKLSKAFLADNSSPGKEMFNRYLPHTRVDKLTVNCCAKCNGDIFVI